MKRIFLLLSSLILIISFSDLYGQRLIKESLFAGSTYASDKVKRIFIPPPEEFLKGTTKGGAKCDVIFNGFPQDAQVAVNHAASILESILPADVHITINANWVRITSSGVLGNSSTTAYAIGWGIDAWEPWAIYPVALAEKIAGVPLNEDEEGDIDLNINSLTSWYYGTDGNTPTLKYDLVTVVLHELMHGIGFIDSYYVESSTGSYGIWGIPMIYDIFIENFNGNQLTDTLLFLNPSSQLKTELTGKSLWFDGPVVNSYTGGGRARIYAPSVYDIGSSIAHLDEDTYVNENALMTPFISRAEAIHDPGMFARSMLGDIGWINTRIVHESPGDTEENIPFLTINAEIVSDTSYNHDKILIIWSSDDFKTSHQLYMFSPSSDDNYTATIPVPAYESRLDYFISAEDYFLRTYLMPSDTAYPYSVYIGTDTVKPIIRHSPPEYFLSVIDSVNLSAEVADNIGIDTVYIEYRINAGATGFAGMKRAGEYNYKLALDAGSLAFSGGDSLQYRIIAIDRAGSPNQEILPSEGYYSVKIEQVNPTEESYTTDFFAAGDDFIYNGFEVTIPEGFSDFGLHTKHPYESPEETGDSIGYTALLRTPVRYDGLGMIISYDEVVLVEPGETDSQFGSTYFYDYVIVEGSSDYGKTWIRLTDGYDSRYNNEWEESYNSSTDDMNSTFVGNESMLFRHTIFPKVSQYFNDGDIMMVRFRLFSDPYANGWGWCIQNLHIGPLINSIDDIEFNGPVIFPNPGDGRFTIRLTPSVASSGYRILNSTGTCLRTGSMLGMPEISIDISRFPSGLYFIVLYNGNSVHTIKYNLVR